MSKGIHKKREETNIKYSGKAKSKMEHACNNVSLFS